MNVRKLSVNKACIFLAVLLLAAMVTVSVALYALTQDITAVWYVLLFGIFVLFCSICFMVLVRRKLAMFSDAFCSLMDDMLSGNMQPKQTVEEESLFYKIEYRLNRLYEVMQENKNSIAQERADLQELISDISHQVKTPIANLKMINSTLLENEVPVQKQKEFLTAQASQLDKLDFLMQAMIKTSRLETGVISLEKKSQPLYDTLAAALGDILLNAEKKQIKPDSFRASVLKGMMHFVELYHGEFSEERLLRALRSIHPVDIYRIGQDDPAKLRGWKKYVFPVYTAYNGKCRKDALPMKF